MSDYAQIVFYGPKDALITGNPAKLIKGVEIDAELDAISDAIATKADLTGDTIAFADGTAGAPAITFSADPDTGFYRAASGTVNFSSNTVATLRFDAQGLGLSDGSAGTPSAYFFNDTNTGLRRAVADQLLFVCGGNDKVRVADGANPLSIAAADASGDCWIGFYESAAFTTRKGYIGYGNAGDDTFFIANEENTQISILTNGNLRWTITAAGNLVCDAAGYVIQAGNGVVGTPGWGFQADPDTGLWRSGSGTIAVSSDGTQVADFLPRASGSLRVSDEDANFYRVGYRDVPQNSQSANYTLVASDAGKHIYHPSGGGAGDTFTIPSNASVAYPLGTVLTFVNADSNSISIAITTDTLTLAGTTSTGTRTLAQNGVATAVKHTTTGWLISGTGLT